MIVNLEVLDGPIIPVNITYGRITDTVIADTALGCFTLTAASMREIVYALEEMGCIVDKQDSDKKTTEG